MQNNNKRSVYQTQRAIELMQEMRGYGTKVATNIITDDIVETSSTRHLIIKKNIIKNS